MRNYLIAALLVGVVVLFLLYFGAKREVALLANNQEVLLDSAQRYRFRDSLNGVSIGALRLEVSELKRYRASDVKIIRDLNLRLRRVQSVSKVFTESSYNLMVTESDSSRKWLFESQWMKFSAIGRRDTLSAQVVVYDTLIQVLHRVPRFKFLGIWFGTKGVRQEIVSKNPHTVITAAEYLEIER